MGEEDPAGGSGILGQLIDEHGDELHYDLWCAGVDLAEFVNENSGWTPVRLLSFIEQLPEESATRAALNGGPEYRGWTIATYILANMYDALNTNSAVSGHWKNGKPPKFAPHPRPGLVTEAEEKQAPPTLESFHNSLVQGMGDSVHQL